MWLSCLIIVHKSYYIDARYGSEGPQGQAEEDSAEERRPHETVHGQNGKAPAV